MFSEPKDRCIYQLKELKKLLSEVNVRVISDYPDELLKNNANFLNKSFLTMACSYLECYLKDISTIWLEDVKQRVESAKIPANLIRWEISQKLPNIDSDFRNLVITKKDKDIEEHLSGNPFRTRDLFGYIGIKLKNCEVWENNKDHVQAIITKRNRIIHHNDDASDLSFGDIIMYVDVIIGYVCGIFDIVTSQHGENHNLTRRSTMTATMGSNP